MEDKQKKIINLGEVGFVDIPSVGGKASSLGELKKEGIEIPEGFVLTSQAFNEFLEENNFKLEINKILDEINLKNMESLNKSYSLIKKIILSGNFSKDLEKDIYLELNKLNSISLAVRSSSILEDTSNHSFAGQFESFLEVNFQNIFIKIKECWASLFNPRSLSYRLENKLEEKTDFSFAVIIQEMVQTKTSGVIFSKNPLNGKEEIILEISEGLGDKLVSGKINPTRYVLDKKDFIVTSENIENKSVTFSKEDLMKIREKVLQIEDYFGYPCDIEFAKGIDSKFYILQCRPITSLEKRKENKFHDFLNLDLIYEVEGGFTPVFLDLIVRNFVDIPLIASLNNKKLSFFFNPKEIEDYFLEKTFVRLLSEKKFNQFIEKIKSSKNQLEKYTFENIIKSPLELLEFFSDMEVFLKNYNLIDFDLSVENKEKIKKYNSINLRYENIQNLRNELREFVNNFIFSNEGFFNKFFKLFAKEKGVHPEDIFYYTKEEILNLYLEEKILGNEISRRKKSFTLLRKNNNISYHFGDRFSKSIVDFKKNKLNFKTELIKGTSCFFNEEKLSGKVKIFPRINLEKINNQISSFLEQIDSKEEFILVLESSLPEMTPLMKEAKAIITDYGGMNSHAGIIAREFKVPCLVGTKISTSALKNGDSVEINFKEGYFKKI